MEDDGTGPLFEHFATGKSLEFPAALELAHGVVIMNVERFRYRDSGGGQRDDVANLFKVESSDEGGGGGSQEEEEELGVEEAGGAAGVAALGNLRGGDQGPDYLGFRAAGTEEEEEEEEENEEDEEDEEDENGAMGPENQGEAQQYQYAGGNCGGLGGAGGFEYGEYGGRGELIPNAAGGQEAQERLGRGALHTEHYQGPYGSGGCGAGHDDHANGLQFGVLHGDDVPLMGCSSSFGPKVQSIFDDDDDVRGQEEEEGSQVGGGDGGLAGCVSSSGVRVDEGEEEECSDRLQDPCALGDIQDGVAATEFEQQPESPPRPLRIFNEIHAFKETIIERGNAKQEIYHATSMCKEPAAQPPTCIVAGAGMKMEDSQKLPEEKGTPTLPSTRGKSGRVSRELGALLDAQVVRPRRAGKGFHGKQTGSKEVAFQVDESNGGAAQDGSLAEGFRFQNETGRIRLTRSRATGRFICQNQDSDHESACPKGAVLVPGKKTRKRSAGRGGRQGWGNCITIHTAESNDVPGPAMNRGLEGPHVDLASDHMTEARGSVERLFLKKKLEGTVWAKKKGHHQHEGPVSMEGKETEQQPLRTIQHKNIRRRGKNQRRIAVGKGMSNGNEIGHSVSPNWPTELAQPVGKLRQEDNLNSLEVDKILESSSTGSQQSRCRVDKDVAKEAKPLDNSQLQEISHINDVHISGGRVSGKRHKGPESLACVDGQFEKLRVSRKAGFLGQETAVDGNAVNTNCLSGANGTASFGKEQGEETDQEVMRQDALGCQNDTGHNGEGEEIESGLIMDQISHLSRGLKEACNVQKQERIHNLSAAMAGNKIRAGNAQQIEDQLESKTSGDGGIVEEISHTPFALARKEGEEEPVDVGKAGLINIQANPVAVSEAMFKALTTLEPGEEEAGHTDHTAKEEYSCQWGKSSGLSGEDAISVTSWDATMHKSFGHGDGTTEGIAGDNVTDAGGTNVENEQIGAASDAVFPKDGKVPLRNRKGKSGQVTEAQRDTCSAGKAKKLEVGHKQMPCSKKSKVAVGKHVEKDSLVGEKGPLEVSEGGFLSHEIAKTADDLASSGKGICEKWSQASQVVHKGSVRIRKCNTPAVKPLAASRKCQVAVEAPALAKQGRWMSGVTKKSMCKKQAEPMLKKNSTSDGNCTGGDAQSLQKGALGGLARDTDNAAVREEVSSEVTEGVTNTRDKVDASAGTTPRVSWVLCDDCGKWRCIPVDLADEIDATNRYWSCSDNPNKEFADCCMPQEKSDAEINRELEISENSECDEEDGTNATCEKPMEVCIQETRPAVWTLIHHNIFNHRSQKHQDLDEAMVCQCRTPTDGEVACGENCLNRMLSIECLSQQCPCGTDCSNQQFQKGAHIQVQWFRCGKKGFGLKIMENVCKDSFIIEYVGEVLNIQAYEARQKEYAMKGQKHFYFMSLSSSEVIDACIKGNLGRFINHSCEPNCRTEKWTVDGEVCIGLFANRDLIEGEEITFNYNYERVGGAVAKKCECGAVNCRGFIGGDPDTPHTVVENESDEDEDLEPIMLQADDIEEPHNVLNGSKVGPVKKLRMTSDSDVQDVKVLKATQGVKRKALPSGAKEGKGSVKRVKTIALPKKSGAKIAQSKGLTINVSRDIHANGGHSLIRNMHYSEVEEKLGEMSDSHGGLQNRRDAAKQYLKLLVLTATSGDSVNGTAACSMRDLSLLLEGLLQTNKGAVLKDIMNKNGLQIFHNLIKQFRRQWEKIPILRKLLKVLDHLAVHKALTVEHIYANPPRDGIESFSDSLYELSKHKNVEVHTMARSFRRKYVPPRLQSMDLQSGNGYRHASPLRSQPSDQLSERAKEHQLHMASPSQDSYNIQSDRSISRPGQQQPSSLLVPDHILESGPKSCFVQSSACNMPQQQQAKQEDLTATQDPFSVAIKSKQPVGPATTKRKRPSRWDTLSSTHRPDTEAATIDLVTAALSTNGAAGLVWQVQPSSLSPCEQQVTSLEVSNSRTRGQVTKLPMSDCESGSPQFEASPDHLGGSQDQDSKTVASSGSLQTAWSSSETYTPAASTLSTKSSLVELPAGPPRPGQPSVHANIPPLSQATGGHASSGHQQMVVLPGQPAMPAQIFVGMPGQMPIVTHLPPGPVHMGMQVIPLGNGMAVVTHASNLFAGQPPTTLVPPSGGAPPNPPMHGGLPQMSLATAPPLPFGFPAGPPSQGVHQPVSIVPAASYVPWQMQPSGQPPFAGGASFTIAGQPKPPAPPMPSWSKNWSSQHARSWGRGSTSGKEASRASNGHSGSSCTGSKVVQAESQGLEVEPEPPVPGLSPVRAQSGLNSHRSVHRGSLSGPSQGPSSSRQSKKPYGAMYRAAGPAKQSEEDTAKCSFHSSTGALPTKETPSSRAHVDYKEPHIVQNRFPQSWHPQGSGQEASGWTENHVYRRSDYTVDELGAIVSWETPECSSFEQHVSAMVRYRVDSHHKANLKDAERLCSKLTEDVVKKEIKKYMDSRIQGTVKPIFRSRLLDKVVSYVDMQVMMYTEKKSISENRH